METPKKNSFISENGNPKKVLMFLEMELLNPCSKNTKNPLQKKCLIFQDTEISYYS